MNDDDEDPSKRSLKTVLVLLGDPRLPDKVKRGGKFNPEDMAVIDRLKSTLRAIPGYQFLFLDNHLTLTKELEKLSKNAYLVINFCDEGFLNDPLREKDVPEILERHALPYTGAGPDCMEVCYDKGVVLQIAEELNIPLPINYLSNSPQINFPVILKPKQADGGLGITQNSIVDNHSQMIQSFIELKKIVKSENDVLIQEFLTGSDLSIGIIGNVGDFQILPIIEEDYDLLPDNLPKVCGYEAKWLPNSPYWQIRSKPAKLTSEQKKIIEDSSMKLFKHLGCRDYARFDWRIDQFGIPKLLEANPNCGWCHDGHLNKMAAIQGWTYDQLLQAIIKSAEKRHHLV